MVHTITQGCYRLKPCLFGAETRPHGIFIWQPNKSAIHPAVG